MGRPHTSGLPFTSASRAHASVYVCSFTNGMVKVGFTNNPRTRLTKVHTTSRKTFGCGIDRFVVFDGVGWTRSDLDPYVAEKHARLIERYSIKRLSFIGRSVKPYTEFFDGIDFARAVEAVKGAILNKQAA